MNIYGLLRKLAETSLPSDQDKKAASELIQKLEKINAFGSAAASIESDTMETVHVHKRMTEWVPMNPSKLHDVCDECGAELRPPYDPRYTSGNTMYFRR